MRTEDDRRREVLRALLEGDVAPREAAAALADFPWDSETELAVLSVGHLERALDRQRSGTMSGEDLSDWAEMVSERDDIGYEPAEHAILADAMFRLATPELFGSIGAVITDVRHQLKDVDRPRET